MHIQSFGSKPAGLLLLFVCLLVSWQAKGQSGFENRIVIQVDDPSVKATVDNAEAAAGETVTLTLTGLASGKTAEVTAGSSGGATDYTVTTVKDNNTYTVTMPSGVLYIGVKVTSGGQVIWVQTPGISSGLATVALSVEGNNPSAIKPGETAVQMGSKVTATLTLQPKDGQTLTLQRITGQSPDGSWVMVPVVASPAPTPVQSGNSSTIEFTMPASEVILTYTISSSADIKEEPTPDGPDEDPVEVPEIAWPNKPNQDPVLVITHEIEEDNLALLNTHLQQLPGVDEEEGTMTELVDISLQLGDGTRVQPDGSVTVTYPYPQGTDASWNFCIVHQISDDEQQQLSYETIYPESLHIGLRFKVSSFSPFAIIYTPPLLPEEGTDPVRVVGISLNKTALTLSINKKDEQLKVTFNPSDATDRRVVWTSDNEAVLTVSADGVLTPLKAGNARVTARSANGGFQATCQVTVTSGSSPDPDPDPSPDPDPNPDPDPEPDPDPDPDLPVANAAIADSAPQLHVSEGYLRVESGRPVTVQVFGLSGKIASDRSSAVSHQIVLPSGIWLVSIDRAKAIKILIP
jgi:hypothetical protein